MAYRAMVAGERFVFGDLRELLAKAGEQKSGDMLAGIAACSERERVAAKLALADVTLGELAANPVLDDEVTELAASTIDADQAARVAACTVGELRELVLADEFARQWQRGLRDAFAPEAVAAVVKLMSDKDLVVAAAPLRTVVRCRNTQGAAGVFGVRVQPNHPADALDGIAYSALDGLLFGCGDATIGVNPVIDTVESVVAVERLLGALIDELAVPTQSCVLAHVTTQLAAMRRGAPIDLCFQSIAGSATANRSFGIDAALLFEAREATLEHHATRAGDFIGRNVMYFETGEGSELSADAHHGVDQLTLEARSYGFARAFDPFLVNSVVGFIGPEYLADSRQIIRAGLEDHFMGKLLGLPMGVDVCYTNHADADLNTNDDLLMLLALAGCNFVMGVPASDDVMLGYQSTSYHDAATIRALLRLRPAPEFERWLDDRGITVDGRLADPAARRDLYARTTELATGSSR